MPLKNVLALLGKHSGMLFPGDGWSNCLSRSWCSVGCVFSIVICFMYWRQESSALNHEFPHLMISIMRVAINNGDLSLIAKASMKMAGSKNQRWLSWNLTLQNGGWSGRQPIYTHCLWPRCTRVCCIWSNRRCFLTSLGQYQPVTSVPLCIWIILDYRHEQGIATITNQEEMSPSSWTPLTSLTGRRDGLRPEPANYHLGPMAGKGNGLPWIPFTWQSLQSACILCVC